MTISLSFVETSSEFHPGVPHRSPKGDMCSFLNAFSRVRSPPLPKGRVELATLMARAFADLDRLSRKELPRVAKSLPRDSPAGVQELPSKKRSGPARQRRAAKRASLALSFAGVPRPARPAFSVILRQVERRAVQQIVTELASGKLGQRLQSLEEDSKSEDSDDSRWGLHPATEDDDEFERLMKEAVQRDAISAPTPPSAKTALSLAYGTGISALSRYGSIAEGAAGFLAGGLATGSAGAAAATPILAATGVGLPVAVGSGLISGVLALGASSTFLASRGIRLATTLAKAEVTNEFELAMEVEAGRLQAASKMLHRLGRCL